MEELSSIANTHPLVAFSAFSHGIVSKWKYGLTRDSLLPSEEAFRYKFIPAITGRTDLSENKRHILSLPAKNGSG